MEHVAQTAKFTHRIVEVTKGEVTWSTRVTGAARACGELLEWCGGEEGMPGDTIAEVHEALKRDGQVVVTPYPGCVVTLEAL